MTENTFVVCRECDLICRAPSLARGQAASCPRCRARLLQHSRASLDQALALSLTTAVLFLIMNSFPLLAMHLQQTTRATTLFGAALAMWDSEMHVLALLVILTTICAPALQIALELYVLLQVRRANTLHVHTMRWLEKLRPWSMVEVFMLGLLVALVKPLLLSEVHT